MAEHVAIEAGPADPALMRWGGLALAVPALAVPALALPALAVLALAALTLAACLAAPLAAATAAPARAGAVLDRLRALRDRARPIVVVSDAPGDPRVAAQLSALDRAGRGLADRDVSVLREAGTGGPLRAALGLPERGFAVVLVGKDGGVKAVWRAPVEPRRVFALIDAMPMRRREMRG